MMNIDEAEALHVELLQSLPGTGDATSALSDVVRLHRPTAYPTMPFLVECRGCDMGPHPEGPADWPCSTIETINAYAHVAGLPTY
jgi:hypothetical protein